ncbi:hypothetical protein [Ureibacillus acetophenoni]
MKTKIQLTQLLEVILHEMDSNKEFAEKIRGIFNADEQSDQISGDWNRTEDRGLSTEDAANNENTATSSTIPKKRSRKRNAALFNPETILEEQGESVLLESLNQLEVDQLKDIVSEFGMDPGKRVMRLRKKEKFISHIVDVVNHRVQKGKAFRRIN